MQWRNNLTNETFFQASNGFFPSPANRQRGHLWSMSHHVIRVSPLYWNPAGSRGLPKARFMGGRGRDTRSYKRYSSVPPMRHGFLGQFGIKTGIYFAHFGLESGMVFDGTMGVYERFYCFNSRWIRTKIEICEFEMYLKHFLFALWSYDWWHIFLPKVQVWKQVWILEIWPENRFLVWNRVRGLFLEIFDN